MKKEIFNDVKNELKYIGILLVVFLVVFKLIFIKEDVRTLARYVISLFWLFVLPGYFLMLYWKEKLGFTERLVVGSALAAAVIGIFSYYLGLMGVNIKYHGIIFPIFLVIIGFSVKMRK